MNQKLFETTQKYITLGVAAVSALVGFEAISYAMGLYQLRIAIYLAFFVYAVHVIWLTFVFDLHLRKRGFLAVIRQEHKGARWVWEACKQRLSHLSNWEYLRHYQNYLVLPALIYWSTVILLFLNPFRDELKQTILILATIALSISYWYMHEHISRMLEERSRWVKSLALVKLFTAFLVYSAVIGTTFHFDFGADFLVASVLTLTFLLVYQALFQHKLLSFMTLLWVVALALVMAVISLWVYSYWNSEYFTAGLVMLAVYNTMWGLLHHYLDQTLSKKVVVEYIIMLVLIISFLFAGHNFNQRIV